MRHLVLCFILIIACFLVWDMGDYESAEISNSELSPNYPNPFNLAMTDYSIPVSGDVALVFYNLAGQKMRTLINERRAAPYEDGLYFYPFIGADNSERWQCISHKEDNSLHLVNEIKMTIYAIVRDHDILYARYGSVLLT